MLNVSFAVQNDKANLLKANYFGQAIACKMDTEAALHTAARSAYNSVQQIANNIGLATVDHCNFIFHIQYLVGNRQYIG